jgi:hypothetical protein
MSSARRRLEPDQGHSAPAELINEGAQSMANTDKGESRYAKINDEIRQERARMLDMEERILRLTARLIELEAKTGRYC